MKGSWLQPAAGIILALGLLAWQGWLTATLFGGTAARERLFSAEPIISGRHPLHLYHGYLGTRSLLEQRSLCCYDTAFQAGYPKTPVFDSGSRPAELFLLSAGGTWNPSAYKLGLAAVCLLAPLVVMFAARCFGLGWLTSCWAGGVSILIWWGMPGRGLLEIGDVDLLSAGLAGLLHAGLLVRFDRAPGIGSWLGLFLVNAVGWFVQPVFFVLLLPLNLCYYLAVGVRQHHLGWHLGLLSAWIGGLIVNLVWLMDWVNYWWLRSPLSSSHYLPHRTWQTVCASPIWGDPLDRVLIVPLLVLGTIGIVWLCAAGQRVAALVMGVGGGGLLALTVAGLLYPEMDRCGSTRLLVLTLLLLALPASHALMQGVKWLHRWTGSAWKTGGIIGCLVSGAVWGTYPYHTMMRQRAQATTPLKIGLGPERLAVVDALRAHTTAEARILWEDRRITPCAPGWSALLPVLTERVFLGGLDAYADVEFAYPRLVEDRLAHRPLKSWTDAELEEFCERYNIGWVVCWSPAALTRFQTWANQDKAEVAATLSSPEGAGCLFALRRPHSYILKGQARWLGHQGPYITLADVVPEDGQVVLSLHYQADLLVSPPRVQIMREPDPFDPIPLIRLNVPGPVSRITLSWRDH
ncbi:MAG: hypothetical protein ACK4RK_05395 [Gemmataceae bacterium]